MIFQRLRGPCLVSGLVVVCIFCGCGGGESARDENAKPHSDPAAAIPSGSSVEYQAASTGAARPRRTSTRRPDEVWEDADGRRFIGKVPYDVFFDHPLAVASGDQQMSGSTDETARSAPKAGSSASVLHHNETSPTMSIAESLPSRVWDSILPADVLQSEVISIRNFLNQKLQSVGRYNSAVTMIPARAATVAVLAGIAMQHSGNISWKEDAGYIRDLAASMNKTPLQRGPADQRRLLGLFENLVDTLNRSRPGGLVAPDPDTPLSEVAEMGLVMKRMEESEHRLRTEVNESSFETRTDLVVHEAAILSGLMHVMMSQSYGFSDDPEFKGFAQQILLSGQAMRDAADKGNFGEFELSLSRVAGTCQACHREYKSN